MFTYIGSGKILVVLASFAGILSSARTFSAQFNVGQLSGTIIGCLVSGVLNNGMNILEIVVLTAVFVDYIKKLKA